MCMIVLTADTGNNRKIVNFRYSCLYARPMKVVSVDNIIRNNHFYYFIHFMMLQHKNDEHFKGKLRMKILIYSSKK